MVLTLRMSLRQQIRNLHRVFDVLSRDSCLIGLAFFDEADRLNACERQNRDGKKENNNAFHGVRFQPLVDLRTAVVHCIGQRGQPIRKKIPFLAMPCVFTVLFVSLSSDA
jgi:hypothetical protein